MEAPHVPVTHRKRIYVGDLHPDVTREDVQALIAKVCTVESIHIPGKTPTGILRQFAMVVVHCDDAQLTRCIKAFNGSLWKGAKLHVEAASKEYYLDRVDRERQEHEMQLCEAHLAEQQRQQDIQPAPFCSAAVTVRSSRYCPRLVVSTRPGSNKGSALRCGRHVVFDDAGVAAVQDYEGEEEEDDDDKGDEEGVGGMDVEQDEVPAPPALAPKLGGGARLGFGSLLRDVKSDGKRKTTTSLQPGTEDRDCCIEAPSGRRSAMTRASSSSSSGARGPAFMDYIDVTDDDEGAYGGQEEEGEGGACVSAEDVGEEALARERRRTSAMLAQLLRGAGADLGDSTSSSTADANSTATTFGGSGGAAEAPCEAERPVHGRGWSVTQTPRYDPTSEAAHTFELSDAERLAILSAQRADNTRKAAMLQEQQQQQGNDGQADLGRLKEIFNRQGGVWFGDDGTTAEAVARGVEGQDKLFIEAEKHGLDLRQEEERGAMRFSFFGDDAGPDAAAAPAPVLALNPAPGLGSSLALPTDSLEAEGVDPEARPAAAVMSLAQIIASARQFQRGRAEEDVVRDWQGMRDRASLGYKRKRKDAAKKGQGLGAGGRGLAKYGAKAEVREAEGGSEGPTGHRAFGKPRRGGKGKGRKRS